MRSRNDQNIPDTGKHEHAQRVIDHRLIIDRKKLFRNGYRQRIKTRTTATGEDNAFHLRSITIFIYRKARVSGTAPVNLVPRVVSTSSYRVKDV
jgi:hypothetical protein